MFIIEVSNKANEWNLSLAPHVRLFYGMFFMIILSYKLPQPKDSVRRF